jgi:hypothetical protein
VFETVKDQMESLRARGAILTVKNLIEDIHAIPTQNVLYDKIILNRILATIDYVLTTWENNSDEEVVKSLDKTVIKELVKLLAIDYRDTDLFSKKFGKEILTHLEQVKIDDYIQWKSGNGDYNSNKIYDQHALTCILESLEETFINPTFEKIKNVTMLLKITSKEDTLLKLLVSEFDQNKMSTSLATFFKNEQKVILKKVDDPFGIDMKAIRDQTAAVVLKKWKEGNVDSEVYIALTALSSRVFEADPTEDITNDSAKSVLALFKNGEFDPEQIGPLDEFLKYYFVDLQTTQDQFLRAASRILVVWRKNEFVNSAEYKKLVLRKWTVRRAMIMDFVDPRPKFKELEELKKRE